MDYCGIDEAGLGPLLGPLVVARSASNVAPEELLAILLGLGIWPQPSKKQQGLVADSKQIYRGDFARLETLALSFYLSGMSPKDNELRVSTLLPETINELDWYRDSSFQSSSLPLVANRDKIWQQSALLSEALRQRNLCVQLSARLFTEKEFNQKIEQLNNKSLVLRTLVGSLIRSFVDEQQKSSARSCCVVDRLGGLKYYASWLCQLFGTDGQPKIEVLKEDSRSSEYRLHSIKQNAEFDLYFWVQGDQRNILCAIASIFAKYLRELLMLQLNRYWQSLFPKVPITTGYYKDAMIFMDYLQKELGYLPVDLKRNR